MISKMHLILVIIIQISNSIFRELYYHNNQNFSMTSKNKRYLKNQNAWEDDDRKFDEELEQKHNDLLLEDLYPHQRVSRHDENTRSRSDFKVYNKKKICFDEDKIECVGVQKLKATSDSSNKSPVEESEHFQQTTYKDEEKLDCSDIVCVDQSIENIKNVEKSKSKIERFKELVDQSNSKHLSSITSINVCCTNEDTESLFNINSEDFNILSQKLEKMQIKDQSKNKVIDTLDYFKEELSISKEITSCLLLPSLKVPESCHLHPAVYDFIYSIDKLTSPTLSYYPNEFRL